MATSYGTQNTLAFDTSGNATGTKIDARHSESDVHVIRDDFIIPSGGSVTTGTNEVLVMGGKKIPKNATILDATVYCDNLVSTTVDVGIESDPDLIIDGVTTVTSSVLRADDPATAAYTMTADEFVTVTLSAAQTNAAARALTVVVFYAAN